MDRLDAQYKSLRGNTGAHVISNGKYTRIYPGKDGSSETAKDALADFIDDVGVPQQLITDGAASYIGPKTPFRRLCTRERISLHTTEPGQKNQNHAAEHEIGQLKKKWRRRRLKRGIPNRLWDYGMVYESELMNRYARGPDGRTGIEEVTGVTPDISEWCDFEFYDLVWYRPHGKLNEGQNAAELALWIGVSHRTGSDMCYWILPKSGIVQSHTTVQHVTAEDYADSSIKARIEEFQQDIKERINDENFYIAVDDDGKLYLDDEPTDNAFADGDVPDYEDNEFPDDPDDEEDAGIDQYLNSELMFEEDGVSRFGKVV